MRLIQSLNTNLKKPCIVIALHNTLFFHRGLFKGRSHLRSPCIYLAVLNNLICKSGFQNIAIGNYESSDVLCITKKLTKPVPLGVWCSKMHSFPAACSFLNKVHIFLWYFLILSRDYRAPLENFIFSYCPHFVPMTLET